MRERREELKKLLYELNLIPKKSKGQSFLLSESIASSIVDALSLSPGEHVLEIGGGLGILTRELLKREAKVHVVELEKKLANLLSTNFPDAHVIQANFLRLDLSFLPEGTKVVGNLPYSITKPILTKLLRERKRFPLWVITIQKEVAERILAQPGTREYGFLSILFKMYAEVEYLFTIRPDFFYPRPGVLSAVLRVRITEPPFDTCEEFERFIKLCLRWKRKTLYNNLKDMGIDRDKIEKETGISLDKRAEDLRPEEFHRLYTAVKKFQEE
ncbi:ribosomal RNA small subunit methyltransferase A [bacterium]|nr:MAG: ribosomal RNA small subunit methyltransferase A [bacterium]